MTAQGNPTDGRSAFDPGAVRFVLVEPQSAGNIGSSARALKNFGFARLDLVRPACDPLGGEARMMAVDAVDVLERARTHESLDGALGGACTVLGLSRRKGKHRRPHVDLHEFAEAAARLSVAGDLAAVFGREDSGLSDQDLDRCTHLIHIKTAEAYPSLNLAQAVLLVAYGLHRARPAVAEVMPPAPLAEQASRERYYGHLERALVAIGFLTRDNVEPIMRRLRRLYGRAVMTPVEVRLLHGIARQTLWLARRAGLSERVDPVRRAAELPPPGETAE